MGQHPAVRDTQTKGVSSGEGLTSAYNTIVREKDPTVKPGERRFSLVEDQETLDFLNNQEWVKVYRAMWQDPKTKSGMYIVESGNNLIFTNGDYKAPTTNTVIHFNDTSETNMALAKELIYDEESQYGRHDTSKRIIENVYGEGYVGEFHRRDYRVDAREVERGEGANRKSGSGKVVTKQLSLADDLTPEKRKTFIETFDAEFGEGAAEQMFKAHDQMARLGIRCLDLLSPLW